jgi:hypothetical protein
MKLKTLRADVGDREHEALESELMPSVLAIGPTVDEIRQRAYEIHLEHGCVYGRDHDDWLEAERDLMEKHQAH